MSRSKSRSTGWLNAIAGTFLLATACGHATSVGDTNSTTSNNTNTTPPADQKASSRAATRSAARSTGTGAEGVVSGTGRDGAPPLATSPAGLLKPHAIENIQEKLVSVGRLSGEHDTGKLDEPTRRALRDFQQSNNLPATGMPDDITVQKLGLGTEDVFRASQDLGKDAPEHK